MPGDTTSQFDLAVLGADEPLGEAVLGLLEDRDIAVGKLYPLSVREADSTVEFAGQDWPCLPAEVFDFSHAQALIVASRAHMATELVARVRGVCPTLPVVHMHEMSAQAPAAAIAAARMLAIIDAVAGVQSAEAFVALPVAMAGKAGIEELSEQTRGLFNLERPDPEVFPLQIAFNLMPLADVEYDMRMVEASNRLLGKVLDLAFTCVQAPLFFGAAAVLHVKTARAIEADALRKACRNAPGVLLMESDLPAGMPTPATDAAESDDLFIGRIRVQGNRLQIWLVFDPLRLEAGQIVDVVENWIDKPTNSMLT